MLKQLALGILGAVLASENIAYAALPAQDSIAALISHQTCRVQIGKVIDNRLTRRFWIPTRISAPGRPEFNILQQRDTKSKTISEYWDDATTATFRSTQLSNSKVTTYEWSFKSGCNPKVTESIAAATPLTSKTDTFTDADLFNLVNKNETGLIYIWTPGMPLSLEGLASIRDAAKSAKINLKIILDPLASSTGVAKSQKNYKIDNADTSRNASDELFARGFGLHYPALAIYKGKYLSNRIYMGNKPAAVYGAWINQEIKNIEMESK